MTVDVLLLLAGVLAWPTGFGNLPQVAQRFD